MSRAAAAALALALLAGAGGCCGCGSPTFTRREGTALHPPPAPALVPQARILHFGDFGDATCQRDAVAAAIAAAHRRAPFDAALVDGDNIYECGPDPTRPGAEACAFQPDGSAVAPGFTPPDDPLFAWAHDGPLAPLAGIPVLVALGNHDVSAGGRCAIAGADPQVIARRRACLEVAHKSPVWTMPGRHYSVDVGPAHFVVVDSNLVAFGEYGGFTLEAEAAFVASAAAGCGDRACFLVGHHPPATAGSHRTHLDPTYLARVQRLLDAGGGRFRAWLAGHDHDLQHLRTAAGLDVFVSGNTSRGRMFERFESAWGDGRLLFGSVRWGYGVLEIGADGWRYRFESDEGEPVYCCAAGGEGPCEPVGCW